MSVFLDIASDVELTIEMAFGENPLATAPVWTDVTSYVVAGDWKRGRSGPFGSFGPGQANLTLQNNDGRFDPTYISGAYYPDVKALVPLRIQLEYNAGGAATVFYGWAESWGMSMQQMVNNVVRFKARDGFKITSLLNTTTQENQETTGTRIGNLLDYCNWPAGWRSLDTGVATVTFLQTECKSLTSALRQIEDSEGGWFYFRADGDAVFRDRNDRSTASLTTTFGPGATEVNLASGLSIDTDDAEIRNQVSVKSIAGTTQTVNDIPSQTAHTIRTLRQLDLPLTNDAAALTLANLLLARYKDQQYRVGPISVNPHSNPAYAWDALIARDINDKVRVKMDPGYGSGYQQDLFIEGLSHKFSVRGRKWLARYNLSQVE